MYIHMHYSGYYDIVYYIIGDSLCSPQPRARRRGPRFDAARGLALTTSTTNKLKLIIIIITILLILIILVIVIVIIIIKLCHVI